MDALTPQCFAVAPGDTSEGEPCSCCGEMSRSANGFVYRHGEPFAAYLVRWTSGHEDRASWEFVIGEWGQEWSADDRLIVRAEAFMQNGPGLMIVDADDARGFPTLASHRLKRDDVIGRPLAREVFAVYDTIVLDDGRLSDIHPWRVVSG